LIPVRKVYKRGKLQTRYKKNLRIFHPHPLFFILPLILVIFSDCSRSASQKGLIVAGSTSVQPFADKWAEDYMNKYPGRIVNVQGGGSSAGIQAARCGAADIGTSSRELKPEEKDLNEIVVARDGLAVIVHPTNKITGLSLEEVKQIFSGNIRSWKNLGGKDKTITVVTREEGSGTRGAFQEMVMGKVRIFKSAIVEDSNGTVREIVAGDPHSIGYISLGLVNERVKALELDGVAANEQNILDKYYKLVRPFLFVTNGPPSPEAKHFIDFILSEEGQQLARQKGLIAVR
jgi:phosphate transport system substrate-binding protein